MGFKMHPLGQKGIELAIFSPKIKRYSNSKGGRLITEIVYIHTEAQIYNKLFLSFETEK